MDKFATDTNVGTIGDLIRSLSDEEIADFLFKIYRISVETTDELIDVSRLWCDCNGGCFLDGHELTCNDSMHKACIIRWLRSPAACAKIY